MDISAKFDGGSFDSGGPKDANVSMQVINASRIDRSQPLVNPPDGVVLKDSQIIDDSTCTGLGAGNDGCKVKVTLENQRSQDVDIEEIRMVFLQTDSQGGASTMTSGSAKITSPTTYSTVVLPYGGEFKELTPPPIISTGTAPSNQESLTFAFRSSTGSRIAINEGDFFVMSLIIDGERETYFASASN